VVDGAEGVGDPMLAAVTDQEHVDIGEFGVAVRAAQRALIQGRRLRERAGVPMGVLKSPRDDVLEAAEDGPALAGGLVGAIAVVGLDLGPAPGAGLAGQRAGDRL
jgi:hypothetical protein